MLPKKGVLQHTCLKYKWVHYSFIFTPCEFEGHPEKEMRFKVNAILDEYATIPNTLSLREQVKERIRTIENEYQKLFPQANLSCEVYYVF